VTGGPRPDPDALVVVDDLVVEAGGGRVLDRVSLTLPAGSSVGLVGASGSGKTTTALALLGHLRPGMRHTAGACRVDGAEVLPDPPPGLRGATIGFLSQDPGQSLNPYRRIGAALVDLAGRRGGRAGDAAWVARCLGRVGLPDDPGFARRFPHQLSGGQQQRVALALALCREPALLVLDEPTTGLDADSRDEVLAELRRVHAGGVGLLWISHDLGVLRTVADRVLVMDSGRIVEDGPTGAVFEQPASDAAIRLVNAVPPTSPPTTPRLPAIPTAASGTARRPPLLRVRDLSAGHDRRTSVLAGVDLDVYPGEFVAVLGVSGAGKTTLGRCIVGLHPRVTGRITLSGEPLATDVRRRTRAQRARVQMVAQDPAEALHPRQTVRDALARPLTVLRGLRGATLDREVDRLLTAVRIPGYADRLPRELSGGERQRVALARALAAGPHILICDEVTSALDLVTQAAVLDLLAEMRRESTLAVVVITHDLGVAAAADRRVVLRDGRVVEPGVHDDPPALLRVAATDGPASRAAAPR
jgi:peptide/nickel transport system ATP-binding protein